MSNRNTETGNNFPIGKSWIDEESAFINANIKNSSTINVFDSSNNSSLQGICKAHTDEESAHFERKTNETNSSSHIESNLQKYHHPGSKKGYY